MNRSNTGRGMRRHLFRRLWRVSGGSQIDHTRQPIEQPGDCIRADVEGGGDLAWGEVIGGGGIRETHVGQYPSERRFLDDCLKILTCQYLFSSTRHPSRCGQDASDNRAARQGSLYQRSSALWPSRCRPRRARPGPCQVDGAPQFGWIPPRLCPFSLLFTGRQKMKASRRSAHLVV